MEDDDLDYELILEVTFPNDSTAVLSCCLTAGSVESSLRDTFTWERRGEQWHCVHLQTPVSKIH